MGKEETLTVLNLQAECDRLNKKILFLEKENREQRKELSDYAKREEQLLGLKRSNRNFVRLPVNSVLNIHPRNLWNL